MERFLRCFGYQQDGANMKPDEAGTTSKDEEVTIRSTCAGAKMRADGAGTTGEEEDGTITNTSAAVKMKAVEAGTTSKEEEGTITRTSARAKMKAVEAGTTSEEEAGTSSAGARTSKTPSSREFEVFLNFRGPDSRSTVVDVLCDAFTDAGVQFFYDDQDESIRKGKVIKNEIMEGITNSEIYIPIFSKGYASSKWCLLELEKIIRCWEVSQGQVDEKTILPIFYDVDVSADLKLKTDLYKTALEDKKKEHGEDKVKQWEVALQKAAQIKGWNIGDHGLTKLKKLVVEEVDRKLGRQSDSKKELDDYVGIQDRIEGIMKLLAPEASGVRIVAIYGVAGMGKTTLARQVFKKLSPDFPQGVAFLSISDIGKKKFRTVDIVDLQKELISQLRKGNSPNFADADTGVNYIKARVKKKKVLVVLDDLDNADQLSKLAGDTSWFGVGSRVIITTSKDIGTKLKSEGFYPYEMPKMTDDEALKLLCKVAFKSDRPPEVIDGETLRKAVETTGGNPMAIYGVAPFFKRDNKDEWEQIIGELQHVPANDLEGKLRIVYNQLGKGEKEIFLDIACLFLNKEKDDAFYYWEAQQRHPITRFMVLQHHKWIEIGDGNELRMDRSLIELGRNIVDRESGFLGKRSRLWSPEVALEVVNDEKGTEQVEALNLGRLNGQHEFNHKQFKGLNNLTFLELSGGEFKKEDFNNVFLQLRWFIWDNCQPKFRTINCCFRKLVVLMLSKTQINDSWGGWDEIEAAKDLKVLKCTDCPLLKKSPEFSKFLQLERLVFKNCPELEELDQSIGDLAKLKYLCLWCPKLQMLPESVGSLSSLLELDISHTTFITLPESVTNLKSLKVFKHDDCCLEEAVLDKVKRLLPRQICD